MKDREVRLITAAQARAAGISRGMLRSRRYQRVVGSVYVAAGVPLSLRSRGEAALLLVPDGVLSHHTALALWCGVAPVDDRLHISIRRDPTRSRSRIRGLTVHQVGISTARRWMACRSRIPSARSSTWRPTASWPNS